MMKALVYTAVQQVQIQEMDMPVPASNESLIKVEASGICGSDMHAWHGHDSRRVPPLVLGHEVAGTVVEGEWLNEKVTLNPLITCGNCRTCLMGKENICENRTMIGMTRAGGFAEYLTIPNQCLIKVQEQTPFSTAALTEPVAVCVHAVNLAKKHSVYNDIRNQNILVIGAGAIGLITTLILEHLGAKHITLCDTNDYRIETARKSTQSKVINNKSKPLTEAKFDLIFDAVGSSITRKISTQVVLDGGCIVHLGLQEANGDFDSRRLTIGEIAFIGVYTYTQADLLQALQLLENSSLGSLNWVEQRPLAAGQQAFKDIHNNQSPMAKIILTP